MAVTAVVPGLHMIAKGAVNAFLLEGDDGLTVVDTGYPDTADLILEAVAGLGRPAQDVRHILLTHAHTDHVGSAAALKRATGARVLIHPLDRTIAEQGGGMRPMTAAPGLLGGLLYRVFYRPGATVEPVKIDEEMNDGDVLPIAGGIEVIHVPGHCAGQVALLWRARSVLFAADACTNVFGLGDPIGFEDLADGRRSQARLGQYDFDVACFGHGKPVIGDASAKFRRKWG